jgi:hypothetical protein
VTRPRRGTRESPPGTGPLDSPIDGPIDGPVDFPDFTHAFAFAALDEALPLALFPVRLEARFLPDAAPTEIVVRVFPDEIHVDSHVAGLTAAELALARAYWETIWRAAGDPAAVAEARAWLAEELGPYRALHVAWATRPAASTPKLPTPPDKDLFPPLELRDVPPAGTPSPGRARLLPIRWAAFVEVEATVAGPFWAPEIVDADLAVTPALVDLPPGAGAQGFLEAQGLGWTYDLALAEDAGMVIRIPIASLPARPSTGYDRLVVVGVASGTEHGAAVHGLLEAHHYTRGLDLLSPGTATNVTDVAPEAAGRLDVQALFDAEFDRPAPPPSKTPVARTVTPGGLMRSPPAAATALAFGVAGETALDRALGADGPEHELSLAANRALWPATWGTWFADPMSWVDDRSPLLDPVDLSTLRNWFTDFVRADGPLPTLRVGRHPYGLLPVSTFDPRTGGAVLDHLENVLIDLFTFWQNDDAVPLLDPDASDVAPDDDVEEQASDVGAIYGATPHIRELRFRPVDDTRSDLVDLYDLRVGLTGLLCSMVPTRDGDFATEEELETHAWWQAFLTYEPDIRGASGGAAQVDALLDLVAELNVISGDPPQEEAALAIRIFIDPNVAHDDEDHVSGDVFGMASRHQGRVADAQPYLADLGAEDHLGASRAPRLYTAGYGEEGTELPVGVLVAPGTDEASVDELATWLTELHDDVVAWMASGTRPPYDVTTPHPLLRQLLQVSAARVAPGPESAALRDGLARLRDLAVADGAAAIPVLERLLRGGLGLAIYRLDAWMTALATDRLAEVRVGRPTGLQVGGYGWLVNLEPRAGKASQGFIHAPSLDHATTAAVLRSGWSAFGTEDGGSPLAVDLSGPRIRAARSLVEGVRAGQELGRLLGGRFERLLHDRKLDRFIDDVRTAVLTGSGQDGRPPTRIVDGLLVARAYTEGVELTPLELDVRAALEPVVSASTALTEAVHDLVGELDAVADVLFSQAVHGLLRGDAGVAAPTLAATGSADAGLPAVDFPETLRGGRLLEHRVLAVLGTTPGAWPGAPASVLAAAEPRLEAWAGTLLGPPANVVADVVSGGTTNRVALGTLGLGALDAVYGVEGLGRRLLDAAGAGDDAAIAAGRPAGLPDDKIAFDEFVTTARALRALLGRIRPLADGDLTTEEDAGDSRDAGDLATRLAAALALVPADDTRHGLVAAHEAEHPGVTAELLLERLRLVTVEPVPVLPILAAGIPVDVAASFTARQAASAQSQGRIAAWLAQAAKVRADLAGFLDAVQLAELASLRSLVACAFAQSPEEGGSWAGDGQPEGTGAVTTWCTVTGPPPTGPVAGFRVDAWTETIPAVRATSGIAVHFDRPSAVAPNAVLLAVTRGEEQFDLDLVRRLVRNALELTQYRGVGADDARASLGQFLPAAFVPDDLVVLAAESEEP